MIRDDDRLAASTGATSNLETVADRYSDDSDGWEENAVDPREMREEGEPFQRAGVVKPAVPFSNSPNHR